MMIINCINCDKKFNVNSELIPNSGRTIQCGSCNHVWFFKKDNEENKSLKKESTQIKSISAVKKEAPKKKITPDPKVDTYKNVDNYTNKKG